MANPAVSRSVAISQARQEVLDQAWRWKIAEAESLDEVTAYADLQGAIDDLLALVAQEAPQEIRRAFEAGLEAAADIFLPAEWTDDNEARYRRDVEAAFEKHIASRAK